MRILFLDVASHQGLIAAATPHDIVASKEIDHRITDREFVPTIEYVLKKADWIFNDLTRIACVIGPGGFMSLRVGVAAANALSWALGIPSCGVHLSDLYRARCKAQDMVWLHSTKKKEIFVRGFGSHEGIAPEPRCMPLDDALATLPAHAAVIGELIPEHQAAVEARSAQMAAVRPVSEVLPAFLVAQTYDVNVLQPWYGRGI